MVAEMNGQRAGSRKEVPLGDFVFEIRKITAMEAFLNDIAEMNVWVASETIVEEKLPPKEAKRRYVEKALQWLGLAVVRGKRVDNDLGWRSIWVPEFDQIGVDGDFRPLSVERGGDPLGPIDLEVELGLDFVTLATVCRQHSGVLGENIVRVLESFFRLGLFPGDLKEKWKLERSRIGSLGPGSVDSSKPDPGEPEPPAEEEPEQAVAVHVAAGSPAVRAENQSRGDRRRPALRRRQRGASGKKKPLPE